MAFTGANRPSPSSCARRSESAAEGGTSAFSDAGVSSRSVGRSASGVFLFHDERHVIAVCLHDAQAVFERVYPLDVGEEYFPGFLPG